MGLGLLHLFQAVPSYTQYQISGIASFPYQNIAHPLPWPSCLFLHGAWSFPPTQWIMSVCGSWRIQQCESEGLGVQGCSGNDLIILKKHVQVGDHLNSHRYLTASVTQAWMSTKCLSTFIHADLNETSCAAQTGFLAMVACHMQYDSFQNDK